MPASSVTEKLMQTFRLPRELVTFLKDQAAGNGLDLTAYVTRVLDGLRTWYGLPEAATALLEEDRKALGMERHAYLLHLLFHRALELREMGPAFDAPGGGKRKNR